MRYTSESSQKMELCLDTERVGVQNLSHLASAIRSTREELRFSASFESCPPPVRTRTWRRGARTPSGATGSLRPRCPSCRRSATRGRRSGAWAPLAAGVCRGPAVGTRLRSAPATHSRPTGLHHDRCSRNHEKMHPEPENPYSDMLFLACVGTITGTPTQSKV